MMNTREKNLDALRVLAALMVVLLHVSAGYVTRNMEEPNLYFTVGNFFDSITRVCVPIFVMLSGAFILDNPNNREYKKFYQKMFKNIIVPTLIWSNIYFLYALIKEFMGGVLIGREVNYFIHIKNWMYGRPFYHLWYMYMIIGLYVVSPILIRLKEDIGEKNTLRVGMGLILLGIATEIIGKLFWPIQFIQFLGYFILGYSLRKYYKLNPKKPKGFIIGSILSGLTVFGITEIIVRMGWLGDGKLYFYGYLTPFVIIGAIFLFIGFVNMGDFKIDIGKLAKHSFNIYIIHAGILNIIDLIKSDILGLEFNPIWYIPVMTLIVFGLSYVGSLIVSWIMEFKVSKCVTSKIEQLIM